jgi:surface antigen
MAFEPHGNMTLGHVAAVTGVLDSRTVLLTHANWSPIDGRRGQVERNVRAIDVSPGNDWSEVRVWYAPLGDLGTTAWPVAGFIYPDNAPRPVFTQAAASTPPRTYLQAGNPTRQSFTQPAAPDKPRRDVIAEIIRAAG